MKKVTTPVERPTLAENKAWAKFARQTVMPFVSIEERVEDAYRAGFRVARAAEMAKAEKKGKRKS